MYMISCHEVWQNTTSRKLVTKVKKLRQEYKKIKDNHNLTGRGRIQWKYFEKLDKILGTQPATRP